LGSRKKEGSLFSVLEVVERAVWTECLGKMYNKDTTSVYGTPFVVAYVEDMTIGKAGIYLVGGFALWEK
jgi:hypothetical protein